MDPSSTILVALSSRDVSQNVPAISDRVLWALIYSSRDERRPLPEVALDERSAWRASLKEVREALVERIALIGEAERFLARARERGVWVTTPFEETWPSRLDSRLQHRAPVVLYGAGDAQILDTDGIGIVGSRNLTKEGAQVAADIATVAVNAALPVVSGGAQGADQIAMQTALERGGQALGALAHSLVRAMREPTAAAALDDGSLCFVTPYKPDAGFNVGMAMGRNKLIYGLSRATAVVATDHDRGGTWAGATEALKREYGSVAVWSGPGEGAGNSHLAESSRAVAIAEPEEILAVAPVTTASVREPSLH